MRKLRCLHLLAAAALAASLLPACSSNGPAPSYAPGQTFEPALAADKTARVKIAVCSERKDGRFDDILSKINDAAALAGMHVEFTDISCVNLSGLPSMDIFMEKAKEEIVSGETTADAYLLHRAHGEKLFEEGLMMDVAEVTRRNAPVFHSKYNELFPEKLTGIPVGIFGKPTWRKAALMLRDDLVSAGGGVRGVEGLFRFIDESIVQPKKQYMVRAYENDLVSQWVLEKGYYMAYGGHICFGIDDAACAPVLLEDIPGFEDFISSMKRLRGTGALQHPLETAGGKECVAFVCSLDCYYYSSLYANIPINESGFTAQLLSPDEPGYITFPHYTNEIAVPIFSGEAKAAEAARFVEWMYAAQSNYDSIVYGQRGVDFADEAGIYAPMIGGKPLAVINYINMDSLFYSWPGATGLSNSDFYRMPSTAPKNVAKLTDDGIRRNFLFPLARIGAFDEDASEKLGLSDDARAVAKKRDELANWIIRAYPSVSSYPEASFQRALNSLRALNNKWLCEQYQAAIRKALSEAR